MKPAIEQVVAKRKVVFAFDERSFMTIDEVKAREDIDLVEVNLVHPDTGKIVTMYLPEKKKRIP